MHVRRRSICEQGEGIFRSGLGERFYGEQKLDNIFLTISLTQVICVTVIVQCLCRETGTVLHLCR
jgi:hypothetical protein